MPRPYGWDDDKVAWNRFKAMKYRRLKASYNSCHRSARILCLPELLINREKQISVDVSFTTPDEIKHIKKGGAASYWSLFSYLFPEVKIDNKWHCHKETFSDFLNRVTDALEKKCEPKGASK